MNEKTHCKLNLSLVKEDKSKKKHVGIIQLLHRSISNIKNHKSLRISPFSVHVGNTSIGNISVDNTKFIYYIPGFSTKIFHSFFSKKMRILKCTGK